MRACVYVCACVCCTSVRARLKTVAEIGFEQLCRPKNTLFSWDMKERSGSGLCNQLPTCSQV